MTQSIDHLHHKDIKSSSEYALNPRNAKSSSPIDRAKDLVMSKNIQPQAPRAEPSVEDIIDWNLEQALFTGEHGFTTDFPDPESIVSAWRNANIDPSKDLTLHESDLPEILRDAVDHLTSDYDRTVEQNAYLKANRNKRAETQQKVHERLMAAGNTKRDIERMKARKETLRKRIIQLHEVENGPTERPKQTVKACIVYGHLSNRRRADIALNPEGSLGDFEDSVKTYLECLKSPYSKLEEIYHETRYWKYRLSPRKISRVVKEGFFELGTQRDYENMIRIFLQHGGRLYLTQEDYLDNLALNTSKDSSAEAELVVPREPSSGGIEALLENVEMRDMAKWVTGEFKAADDAALEAFAAEVRDFENAEDMQTARIRNDQARVAHDKARRAHRAESQDRQGQGSQRAQGNDVVSRGGTPLRRNQRLAVQRTPTYDQRTGTPHIASSSSPWSPRAGSPQSPSTQTLRAVRIPIPPRAMQSHGRTRGNGGSMSPPASRTRSGKEYGECK